MSFRTDTGGFAFKCTDLKIGWRGTWATRISQLSKQTGNVRIMTYSLPAMEYVCEQIGRRPHNIWLLAHSKFAERAETIKRAFPGVCVAVHPEMHAKVLLIEPKTIWIGSANFGDSDWVETMIGLHSPDAHDYMLGQFYYHWNNSRIL